VACVLTPIAVNGGPISATLVSGCSSTHRAAFAKYWTFTVVQGANNVVIQMTGTGFTDPYLYLLQGIGFTGTVIAEDDDSGPGFQALIQIPFLPPGSYTIETSSFAMGAVGAFTLEIAGVVIPPVVHPPVLISEHLSISESHAAYFPFAANIVENLGVTEATTAIRGAPPVVAPESLTVTTVVTPTGGFFDLPLTEFLTVTEAVAETYGGVVEPAETLAITEALVVEDVVDFEALTLTELASPTAQLLVGVQESLLVEETLAIGAIFVESLDDHTLRVTFPEEIQLADAIDLLRYRLRPLDGGVPIGIEHVIGIQRAKLKGVEGDIGATYPTSTFGPGVNVGEALTIHETVAIEHNHNRQIFGESEVPPSPLIVDTILLKDMASFDAEVGDYVSIEGSLYNPDTQARVLKVGPLLSFLTVDLPYYTSDPMNGQLQWVLRGGVVAVVLTVSKPTNGKKYELTGDTLRKKDGSFYGFHTEFVAVSSKPTVLGATFEPEEGGLIIEFSEPMRSDHALLDPHEYAISGPTVVSVLGVRTLDASSVFLKTIGFGAGSYQAFVNATGTPKDLAGNPVDPSFNAAIFTSSVPQTTRSIFVDRGPITKPPLTIQTGVGITITGQTILNLTLGSLPPTVVGLYIILGSNSTNGGTFLITSWVSPTQITIKANLHLPDAGQATTTWEVYDPRNGEIADDPIDVVVKVNAVPVAVEAVIGLLGQVVLFAPPAPADDVKVDYSFICNPTVEVRRLNSKEFRLNAWNRDQGFPHDVSGHHYRYNNQLIRPSDFVAGDMQARLDQPRQRDLKYRAYEREYSALLNDPNLLLLNSPLHHIAYPPLERTVSASFINYLPTALPEVFPVTPWTRKGTGLASILFNQLIVEDTSSGAFPTGDPFFWSREIDLTFPHVYAATWQVQINAVSNYEGVWTGIAVGFSDELKAIVVGYILDAGVMKVGILRKGFGNDPSQVSSWAGGLDSLGNPTGQPVVLDWSALHSFRIYQTGGVVRVFFDGEIIENMRLLEDDLPFLEELNDPFNQAQNSFFGSLSRPATNVSTWDFVRYLVLPLNPFQTAPSIFVSYEGNDFPETAVPPWLPVGYHGTESIVASAGLLVESTSATDAATEAKVGLIGGDFRGFARLEPLLAVSSDVILDVSAQILTQTNGITPNACMAAIDDGTRLLQLSFFPDRPSPKFSYGGRSLPGDFQPTPWLDAGTAPVAMVGRTLRITDSSVTDGRVYYRDDSAAIGTDARIVAASTDYIQDFRCTVLAHTPDPGGFSGVMGAIYDGSRLLGLMLLDIAGVRYVAPHSDGTLLPGPIQYPFEWNDGEPHTYRLVKSGANVTVFVDNTLLGVVPYAAFTGIVGPVTGTISWGSSTVASMGATSTVDWVYSNVWRLVPDLRHYCGFWKGTDPDQLTGYHLPLKTSGRGAVVIGNALQDSTANFVTAGVLVGDQLVIDVGGNKGTYEIASVTPTQLTILNPITWPVQPSLVNYRVPLQVDWSVPHKYRMVRSPDGSTVLLLDSQQDALITIGYNEIDLPVSSVGVPTVIAGGLPSITWGAFDPTNLSAVIWDFVRYGITRSPTELRIAPHHQILNQRNVMASPEHLRTTIKHPHTDFWSSDVGIPPQTEPDFLKNPLLIAYTLLNEGTPLVPSTQSTDVQTPIATTEFVSMLNAIEDLLNTDGDFKLNDGSKRHILKIPNGVLYTGLQVLETTTGVLNQVTPFCDECESPDWGTLYWQKEVCLKYDGAVLPENSGASTPWTRVDDIPANVFATPFSGVLTYGTTGPTRTVYRNPTSLPDSVGLTTEIKVRMRVLQDTTFGLGDSQVRLGFSSTAGFTLSLAFVTTPLGERYVLLVDQNTLKVLGGIPFDWYDGLFHVYRMVRDPMTASVNVFVDS